MPEIHVMGGRLFSATNGNGVILRRDELALVQQSDGVAFVTSGAIGPQSYDDATGSVTLTRDGRLRVDTSPTNETVNLFAQPSPWGGNPFSRKSPW